MQNTSPNTIHLKSYQTPGYYVDKVDLHFSLGEQFTRVKSRLELRRNRERSASTPLVLDGHQLKLINIAINNQPLISQQYCANETQLTITDVPEQFVLETEVEIKPQLNTALEGLYKSSGNFCTQCEAEGFRAITFYPDRPDVMAEFTTTVVADKTLYPALLSNGNPVDSGELPDNQHFVTWHDPFKKPCYLFALVAGQLCVIEDTFTTASDREVALKIYVESDNVDKCDHAMVSLKNAMRWDEKVYGREYDLDIYMIVAVNDFNMGAMENKGLNVFNSKYVLAKPDTATDQDYDGIESVIAHEYFHNWSGNRVTCRDWFQLSLKEGFTVFRDQCFSADMGQPAIKRIEDVRILRSFQFKEDAGPMAHPIRPSSYEEINNFYTATVYNKGAEVIRMMHTLFGAEGFRKGSDLFFDRFDGQAVTTDDFAQAMAEENPFEYMDRFKRWYDQAGTPEVTVTTHYDSAHQQFDITFHQSCSPSPGQREKQPYILPVVMALINDQGEDLPLQLVGETDPIDGQRILQLIETEQTFHFVHMDKAPLLSLFRGFSAPIKLRYDWQDHELAFLMVHDNDDFNRWEAGQNFAVRLLQGLIADYQNGKTLVANALYLQAFGDLLASDQPPAFIAHALTLPDEAYLAELCQPVDPEAIHNARHFLRKALASAFKNSFFTLYKNLQTTTPYRFTAADVATRKLKNCCLGYLSLLDEAELQQHVITQATTANNMTDTMAALSALTHMEHPDRNPCLEGFYNQWQHDPLVVDKWLSLQATSSRTDAFECVTELLKHPAFEMTNPNKVRALVGAFCQLNPVQFHHPSGRGYLFLADTILQLDAINPQIAARLLAPLIHWKKFKTELGEKMHQQLQRIANHPNLSSGCTEIAHKSLI